MGLPNIKSMCGKHLLTMQTAQQGSFFFFFQIQTVSHVMDSNVIIKSLLLSRTFLLYIDWHRTQSTHGLTRIEMEREQRDGEDNRLYSVIRGAADLSHDSGKGLQDGILGNWKCENDSGSTEGKTPSHTQTHTHTHTHTSSISLRGFVFLCRKRVCSTC